jgi:hypothetical protein
MKILGRNTDTLKFSGFLLYWSSRSLNLNILLFFRENFANASNRTRTMAYVAFREFVSTRFPQIKFKAEAKVVSATTSTTLSLDVAKSSGVDICTAGI